jgi:hypothetical protein
VELSLRNASVAEPVHRLDVGPPPPPFSCSSATGKAFGSHSTITEHDTTGVRIPPTRASVREESDAIIWYRHVLREGWTNKPITSRVGAGSRSHRVKASTLIGWAVFKRITPPSGFHASFPPVLARYFLAILSCACRVREAYALQQTSTRFCLGRSPAKKNGKQ